MTSSICNGSIFNINVQPSFSLFLKQSNYTLEIGIGSELTSRELIFDTNAMSDAYIVELLDRRGSTEIPLE